MTRFLRLVVILICVAPMVRAATAGREGPPSAVPVSVPGDPAPPAPEATPSSPAPEQDDEKIWVLPGTDSPGKHESIEVRSLQQYTAGQIVLFDCEIHCDDTIDAVKVLLQVQGTTGPKLFSAEVALPTIEKGVTPAKFEWPTEALPEGDYSARFTLVRRPGIVCATRDLQVRKIGRNRLTVLLSDAGEKLDALRAHLSQLAQQGRTLSYPFMRTVIADEFLGTARQYVEAQRWPEAADLGRYALDTANSVAADLAFGQDVPERTEAGVDPDLSHLSIEQGTFTAAGKPVFLFGAATNSADPAVIAQLRGYGLNLYGLPLAPTQTLASASAEADLGPRLDPLFSEAQQQNVSVSCNLLQNAMPDWVWNKWPEIQGESATGDLILDLTNPQAQTLVTRHVRSALAYLARQPMVSSVALLNAPEFRWSGPAVRDGFITYIKGAYTDRELVNAAWRKRLRTLDDVDIWPDFPRPAYQYDWQVFHMQLGAELTVRLKAEAQGAAPSLPLRIDVSDSVLQGGRSESSLLSDDVVTVKSPVEAIPSPVERGEASLGTDRESIAKMYPVTGCRAATALADPAYAMQYPQPSLVYTLLRSFAPGNPVVNSGAIFDCGPAPAPGQAYAFVHSALWEAVMSGMNACTTPFEGHNSIFSMPQALEGYAGASLDIRRLAPIVQAFQQAPADVAILWSMPSKIFDRGQPYLSSLRRTYEGCSFGGRKIRFISESQCIQDGLDGVTVLVLPQMLSISEKAFEVIEKYIDDERVIVRSSTPIPYDERGASRRDVISTNSHTILVRGLDSAAQYLHAMDAAYALGMFADLPRVTNDMGYPMEGVKSQYVEFNGESYVYLLNLRPTSIRCRLQGKVQSGRDLIQGRDIAFPCRVKPLDPMLIRLDHAPEQPADTVAAAEPAKTGAGRPVNQ